MNGWKETPVEAAARLAELRQTVGDWLSQLQWHHWLTLTVSGVWSRERLLWEFENRYLRCVTTAAQQRVPYFFVLEGGALGDRPHLHALLGGTECLPTSALESRWEHGRAVAAVFNPDRGAAYYLAKKIESTALHHDWSRHLPPRRVGLPRGEPSLQTLTSQTNGTPAHS